MADRPRPGSRLSTDTDLATEQQAGDSARDLGQHLGAWSAFGNVLLDVPQSTVIVAPLMLPDAPFRCRDLLVAGVGDFDVSLFRMTRIDAAGWEALRSTESELSLGGALATSIVDLGREVQLDRRGGAPWLVALRARSVGARVLGGVPALLAGYSIAAQGSMPRQVGIGLPSPASPLLLSSMAPAVCALTKAGRRFYSSGVGGTEPAGGGGGAGIFGETTVDFGVGGQSAVRVSVADATMTADTRIVASVHVPVGRNLDEGESVGSIIHQVTPSVGVEFLVRSEGATGIFDIHYTRSTA